MIYFPVVVGKKNGISAVKYRHSTGGLITRPEVIFKNVSNDERKLFGSSIDTLKFSAYQILHNSYKYKKFKVQLNPSEAYGNIGSISGNSYELSFALAILFYYLTVQDEGKTGFKNKEKILKNIFDSVSIFATGAIESPDAVKEVYEVEAKLDVINAFIKSGEYISEHNQKPIYICISEINYTKEIKKKVNTINEESNGTFTIEIIYGTSLFEISKQLLSAIITDSEYSNKQLLQSDWSPFPGIESFTYDMQGSYHPFSGEDLKEYGQNYLEKIEEFFVSGFANKVNLLITVHGMSGCGKSSFCNASVIPHLEKLYDSMKKDEEDQFQTITIDFKRDKNALSQDNKEILNIQSAVSFLNEKNCSGKLLFLDQFESVLLHENYNRETFRQQLNWCYEKYPNLNIIIGCRGEFSGEIEEILQGLVGKDDRPITQHTVAISGQIKADSYWQAVWNKLTRSITFEPGIESKIIDQVKKVKYLPAISLYVQELFIHAKSNNFYGNKEYYIGLEDVEYCGDLADILNNTATKTLNNFLDSPQEDLSDIQKQDLKYLFFDGLVTSITRNGQFLFVSKSWNKICDEDQKSKGYFPSLIKLMDAFVEARLVKKQIVEDDVEYQLVHECLNDWVQRGLVSQNHENENLVGSKSELLGFKTCLDATREKAIGWHKSEDSKIKRSFLLDEVGIDEVNKYIKSRENLLDHINVSISSEDQGILSSYLEESVRQVDESKKQLKKGKLYKKLGIVAAILVIIIATVSIYVNNQQEQFYTTQALIDESKDLYKLAENKADEGDYNTAALLWLNGKPGLYGGERPDVHSKVNFNNLKANIPSHLYKGQQDWHNSMFNKEDGELLLAQYIGKSYNWFSFYFSEKNVVMTKLFEGNPKSSILSFDNNYIVSTDKGISHNGRAFNGSYVTLLKLKNRSTGLIESLQLYPESFDDKDYISALKLQGDYIYYFLQKRTKNSGRFERYSVDLYAGVYDIKDESYTLRPIKSNSKGIEEVKYCEKIAFYQKDKSIYFYNFDKSLEGEISNKELNLKFFTSDDDTQFFISEDCKKLALWQDGNDFINFYNVTEDNVEFYKSYEFNKKKKDFIQTLDLVLINDKKIIISYKVSNKKFVADLSLDLEKENLVHGLTQDQELVPEYICAEWLGIKSKGMIEVYKNNVIVDVIKFPAMNKISNVYSYQSIDHCDVTLIGTQKFYEKDKVAVLQYKLDTILLSKLFAQATNHIKPSYGVAIIDQSRKKGVALYDKRSGEMYGLMNHVERSTISHAGYKTSSGQYFSMLQLPKLKNSSNYSHGRAKGKVKNEYVTEEAFQKGSTGFYLLKNHVLFVKPIPKNKGKDVFLPVKKPYLRISLFDQRQPEGSFLHIAEGIAYKINQLGQVAVLNEDTVRVFTHLRMVKKNGDIIPEKSFYFPVPKGCCKQISLSDNGERLAIRGTDQLSIWEIGEADSDGVMRKNSNIKLGRELLPINNRYNDPKLYFNPKADFLVLFENKKLIIFNIKNEDYSVVPLPGKIHDVWFSNDYSIYIKTKRSKKSESSMYLVQELDIRKPSQDELIQKLSIKCLSNNQRQYYALPAISPEEKTKRNCSNLNGLQ